jgi:hypothetical protein
MLTHCVLFWTKETLSKADKKEFELGLRSLLAIPLVVEGSVGVPAAPAHPPAVARSFAVALLLKFRDVAAHDTYQVHPIHNAFVDRCGKYWSKAVVYDFTDPSA